MSHRQYFSKRGKPLVYCGEPKDVPVLTVENYLKWYGLHVVMPDGSVYTDEEFYPGLADPMFELEFVRTTEESPWCDHVFNPKYVEFIAEKTGAHLDEVSLDTIAGRWFLEYLDSAPKNPATTEIITALQRSREYLLVLHKQLTLDSGATSVYSADIEALEKAIEAAAATRYPQRVDLVDFMVRNERIKQVSKGWTAAHDDTHTDGELVAAAACYALHAHDLMRATPGEDVDMSPPVLWPWDFEYWRPDNDVRALLIKATALLWAEIERQLRAQEEPG